MAKIEWDWQLIEEIANRYDSLAETLQEQKNRTEALQKQADGNWQSEAGQLYAERITEDINSINELLSKISELAEKVRTASRAYASGELDIHGAMLDALTNLSIPFSS